MKSAILLASSFLLVATVHASAVLETRTVGDYIQDPSGNAGFSIYSGCGSPGRSLKACLEGAYADCCRVPAACGQSATGYTAAMNQLSFGAPPGDGPGDACGRCFSITGTVDPNTGAQASSTIVVKVTDLCSVSEDYCGQTLSNPINSLNQPMQCAIFPIFFLTPTGCL